MNCEIFVLLEELGFVSEAFNCICSGQLVRSRVESAQHLENSQELHPSLGACFQRPLSFSSKTSNPFVGAKHWEKRDYCQ